MRTVTEQAILVLNRAITRAATHYDAAGPYGKAMTSRNNFIGTIRAAAGYSPESWIAKGESPSAPSVASPLASPSVLSLCFYAVGRTVRQQIIPELKRLPATHPLRSLQPHAATSTQLADFCELISLIPHGVGPVNLHTTDGLVKVLKDTVERLLAQTGPSGSTLPSIPSSAAVNRAAREQKKLRNTRAAGEAVAVVSAAIRKADDATLQMVKGDGHVENLAWAAIDAHRAVVANDIQELAQKYGANRAGSLLSALARSYREPLA